MRIACDIDGVLVDNGHWARFVENWDAFIEAIPYGKPIVEGILLLRALTGVSANEIHLITARWERSRDATATWIWNNCGLWPGNPIHLHMRPDTVDAAHEDPAQQRLKLCQEIQPGLIIEDDEENAKVLVEAGFKVILFMRKERG